MYSNNILKEIFVGLLPSIQVARTACENVVGEVV
jgi:hypothetical protein